MSVCRLFAVALDKVKGCKHYFTREDIARLPRRDERAKETRRKVPNRPPSVSSPHPLPSFFNMAAVSALSSNAQIGGWLDLYLPVPLNFWCTPTSPGCQITRYTFFSVSPPVSLSGITFTNHSLHWAFFLTPKTTNCQPTTVSSAMVWVGALSFSPLHERCVKTAPSWWRF